MPEGKVFPSESTDDDDDYVEASSVSFREYPPEKSLDPTRTNPLESETLDFIEMKHSRKKALLELLCKVEDAIHENRILGDDKPFKFFSNSRQDLKDISIWGVPLLPSKGHQGTGIVLMKFLKASDFNASGAFNILRRTLQWRREFNVDGILDEKLGSGFENTAFVNGEDKNGRPVFYNTVVAIKDRDSYKKTLGTEKEGQEFLRWKVQSMEKSIEKLQFRSGGVDSILKVIDLKNAPRPAMKELRSLNRKAGMLVQEHYPGLIFKSVYVNAPLSYVVSHALYTQKYKSSFIFARPSRVTQTLLKYIAPENLPVQYGGLLRENDNEFSTDDKAITLIFRGAGFQTIQIPLPEGGIHPRRRLLV
ncbi:patellin-4-like isoform X2 [Diospyros lotus]|uniref:patellin-4-like isoform X2 n=1 Tax=Diospyros lotus TaxID=55363 RepID=UPI00224F8998|nr:patellin-4-like isoform X2 [Diospyros lotus]